jgi:hypothetical protein
MRQMDIEQYVSQRQHSLNKGNSRISDFKVFDFNYVPDKPLMREEDSTFGAEPQHLDRLISLGLERCEDDATVHPRISVILSLDGRE